MTMLDRAAAAVLPPQSERSFQCQVIEAARGLGWKPYWSWSSLHSPKGWPDLVLIRRPRIVFLELKAQRTPVTPEQHETIEALRACGLTAMVARPSDWDDVMRILR